MLRPRAGAVRGRSFGERTRPVSERLKTVGSARTHVPAGAPCAAGLGRVQGFIGMCRRAPAEAWRVLIWDKSSISVRRRKVVCRRRGRPTAARAAALSFGICSPTGRCAAPTANRNVRFVLSFATKARSTQTDDPITGLRLAARRQYRPPRNCFAVAETVSGPWKQGARPRTLQ